MLSPLHWFFHQRANQGEGLRPGPRVNDLFHAIQLGADPPGQRFRLDEKAAAAKAAARSRSIFARKSKEPEAGIREGDAADLAVFDISREYVIDPEEFRSKGRSTPFAGWRVYGKCLLTFCRGKKVWSDASLAGYAQAQSEAGGGGSR